MAHSAAPPSAEAVIQPHLSHLLDKRESPKTVCPSEAARALSQSDLKSLNASSWRDTMPLVRGILQEMRDRGEVEILQKGNVIPHEMRLEHVKGPIRARKALSE